MVTAPLWEPSDRTLLLLEREGFLYDSSLMARDFEPYRPRVGDKITADQVVWAPEQHRRAAVELGGRRLGPDREYLQDGRRRGCAVTFLTMPAAVRRWAADSA